MLRFPQLSPAAQRPSKVLNRRLTQAGAGIALVVAMLAVTASPALAAISFSQPVVTVLAPGATGEVTFSLDSSASDPVGKITFTAPGNTVFTRNSYTFDGGPGAILCGLSGDARTLTCPPSGTVFGFYWPGHSTLGVQVMMDPAAPAGTTMTPGVVTNFDYSGVQNGQGSYTAQTPAVADIATTVHAHPHLGILVPYLNYTLTAKNLGPNTATSTTVTATLPAGVTATSLSPGCTTASGTVSCVYGPIASGASASKSFRLPLSLLSLGNITVTGTRQASVPDDPNASNDSGSATCTVISIILATCH
jgi:uncharacterized repeat protein (TIGR01451 family)